MGQFISADPAAAQLVTPQASTTPPRPFVSGDPAAGGPQPDGQVSAPTMSVAPMPTLVLHQGDKFVLLPKLGSDAQSVAHWQSTGEHLGVFGSHPAAVNAGRQLMAQPKPPSDDGGIGAGFMQMQPVHPLATGQAINDYVGKTTALPLYDAYQAAKRGQSPLPAAGQAASAAVDPALKIGLAQGQLLLDAVDAFKQGNYTVGGQKAAEYLIPFLGPLMGQMTDTSAKGETMKAIGQAIGIGTNLLPLRNSQTLADATGGLPADSPVLGRTAPGPGGNQPMPGVQTARPNPAAVPQATPQVAQQVTQWADAQQPPVPLPAGVRTGNRVAMSLQQANARSSMAASHAEEGHMADFTGKMQQAGTRIANDITPTAAPNATVAGPTGRDILADMFKATASKEREAYDEFRTAASDPQHQRVVSIPQTGHVPGGSTPITVMARKIMNLPVDLRAAKTALRPILDRLTRQWPEARKASHPGYTALKNIVEGHDYVPADELDGMLSGLKSIAREQGGVAKFAVGKVEQALQDALDSTNDPTVAEALTRARAATRAKKAIGAVIARLKDEKQDPYTALRIEDIEHLKAQAADAVPVLARGWLQTMMNKAFEAPGRFDHAAALYGGWMRISPKVKIALYGPERVKDITSFFRTAAEVARLENPSGTAAQMATVVKYAHTAYDVMSLQLWNPLHAAGIELTQYALAHLLWSPTTAKLLSKAFTMPQSLKTAASVSAQLTNAARVAGVPVQIAKAAQSPAVPMAAENQDAPVRVGPYTASEVH